VGAIHYRRVLAKNSIRLVASNTRGDVHVCQDDPEAKFAIAICQATHGPGLRVAACCGTLLPKGESVTEPSRDFYDEVQRRGGHFRERAFEFDKLAVGYSQKGFETLTYLNGGALVALPAALAFFKADIPRASIIWTGGAFIVGLTLVVVAQIMAFFTMAKRGEAEAFRYNEQRALVGALTDPARKADADKSLAAAESRRICSNRIRIAGLVFFVLSLLAFIIGCAKGGLAVMAAKEKIQVQINAE
jgi:hypothetical protein